MSRRRQLPEPVFTLRSVTGEVTALHSFSTVSGPNDSDAVPCHSQDGDSLVSGHDTGQLQLWDLTTYRVKLRWAAHSNNRVQWIGSCDGDKRIFSYGRDGLLHGWTINAPQSAIKVLTVVVNCCTHCPCDVTPFGLLATPREDGSVRIIRRPAADDDDDFTDVKPTCKRGTVMTIKFIALENDSTCLLLVAYEDGFLTCHRTISDAVQTSSLNAMMPSTSTSTSSREEQQMITCLDFHVGTMRGILGSSGDTLVVFGVSVEGEIGLETRVAITNPGVACVRVRADGRCCVVGGWDHRIRVFSWRTLKPLAVVQFHSDTVQCLSFVRNKAKSSSSSSSSSDVLLAAGSRDGLISLWDLYNENRPN